MINKSRYKSENAFHVAIDCIIFGFDRGELKLLIIKRGFNPEKGKWSLMGGFLKKEETLDEGAARILHELTGLHDVFMEQLEVFSRLDRDPEARTISVAYVALINIADHRMELTDHFSANWVEVRAIPSLIFDHNEMVTHAIDRLRYRTSIQPVGFELLPAKFTMRQLQTLYEAILNQQLDKRNFTKKMLALNLLVRLDEKDRDSSRKGSYLYRFDQARYEQNLQRGLSFKI